VKKTKRKAQAPQRSAVPRPDDASIEDALEDWRDEEP